MCEETKASMEKHTGCTGIALTCLYTSSSLPVIFFNLLLECVFFFFGAQVVPLSLTDLSFRSVQERSLGTRWKCSVLAAEPPRWDSSRVGALVWCSPLV